MRLCKYIIWVSFLSLSLSILRAFYLESICTIRCSSFAEASFLLMHGRCRVWGLALLCHLLFTHRSYRANIFSLVVLQDLVYSVLIVSWCIGHVAVSRLLSLWDFSGSVVASYVPYSSILNGLYINVTWDIAGRTCCS